MQTRQSGKVHFELGLADERDVQFLGDGNRFLTKIRIGALLDSLLQLHRGLVLLHAVELVLLRFGLDGRATRRARDNWTHGEADLVVGLLYLGPVNHAAFVGIARHIGA